MNTTKKGYVSNSFKVNREQLEYINEITKELSNNHRKLFIHLLISTVASNNKKKEEFYVKCSSTFMEKNFGRGTSWMRLYEAGLIKDITGYSKDLGLSREYLIDPEIINKFHSLFDLEELEADYYNLITGRKDNKVTISTLNDENRHPYPELIREVLKTIDVCYINLEEAIKYVKWQENQTEKAKEEYEKGNIKYEEYNSLKCRYINDKSCLSEIIKRRPEKIDNNIWVYKTEYRPQMSGRISHEGGALQSASKGLKHFAYSGINNLYNFDLSSSQISGLIQQFNIAGIDASWLIDYKNNSEAKYEYAKEVGVSVSCWKNMLCALIMGARLIKFNKKNIEKLNKKEGAILDYLSKEYEDLNELAEAFQRFSKAVKPLNDSLVKWHNYLIDVYVPLSKVKYGKYEYITNATGIKLNITELFKNKSWKIKAVLAAYILQGQEASFIHNLTLLGHKYDYKVIANEHDGVVSIGFIPDEAVKEASNLSGLENAKLVIKSFVDFSEDTVVKAYLDEGDEIHIIQDQVKEVKQNIEDQLSDSELDEYLQLIEDYETKAREIYLNINLL